MTWAAARLLGYLSLLAIGCAAIWMLRSPEEPNLSRPPFAKPGIFGAAQIARSDSAIARAEGQEARSWLLGVEADSLARLGAWRDAYAARTAERDSLATALDEARDAAFRARAAYMAER